MSECKVAASVSLTCNLTKPCNPVHHGRRGLKREKLISGDVELMDWVLSHSAPKSDLPSAQVPPASGGAGFS